ESRFELVEPNQRGHVAIPTLGVELGIWQGTYQNVELPWLRWWNAEGQLLLTGEERAALERQRAETERQRAEKLAAKLRELGVDPDV
ncbi:MAG: Uma2 family endonuclease, partial [Cyanobacteria bacterium P01_H01_bin.121]